MKLKLNKVSEANKVEVDNLASEITNDIVNKRNQVSSGEEVKEPTNEGGVNMNPKLQKILEALGDAAAEPVHDESEAKELTPEVSNDEVYTADSHEQAEDVKEVVVESIGGIAKELARAKKDGRYKQDFEIYSGRDDSPDNAEFRKNEPKKSGVISWIRGQDNKENNRKHQDLHLYGKLGTKVLGHEAAKKIRDGETNRAEENIEKGVTLKKDQNNPERWYNASTAINSYGENKDDTYARAEKAVKNRERAEELGMTPKEHRILKNKVAVNAKKIRDEEKESRRAYRAERRASLVNAGVEFEDIELLSILEANGYNPDLDNLLLLKENLAQGTYVIESLGTAAAEPVATEEKEPKTLSVKVDNDSVYPADEHKQSEDVTPVVVEGRVNLAKLEAKNAKKAKEYAGYARGFEKDGLGAKSAEMQKKAEEYAGYARGFDKDKLGEEAAKNTNKAELKKIVNAGVEFNDVDLLNILEANGYNPDLNNLLALKEDIKNGIIVIEDITRDTDLGDVAVEPVATEHKEPKSLKVVINNNSVYTDEKHHQSDDVEGIIVENMPWVEPGPGDHVSVSDPKDIRGIQYEGGEGQERMVGVNKRTNKKNYFIDTKGVVQSSKGNILVNPGKTHGTFRQTKTVATKPTATTK